MTDVLKQPLWKDEDLGKPLPDDPHAVSVSMPKWNDVIGYEEKEERVITALQTGYPRFIYHPVTKKLFNTIAEKFCSSNETCQLYPSHHIAKDCADYILKRLNIKVTIQPIENKGITAVIFDKKAEKAAKEFWQHAGFIIPSRLAERILNNEDFSLPSEQAKEAKFKTREHISRASGQNLDDIYLFPCGMAGIYLSHKITRRISSDCKTIQLGFPYVDTLKIQERFGKGVHFINYNKPEDLNEVKKVLETEKISAVFCEIPGNPLLNCIDLKGLRSLLDEHNTPLIIDDTVGSWYNYNLSPYYDILATSLTKFFTGSGDVLCGSLIINKNSRFYKKLKDELNNQYEDLLYEEDAIIVEKSSRDFEDRMKIVNHNAEQLCDLLHNHDKINKVYYPKYTAKEIADSYRTNKNGYGGLFSFTLKDESKAKDVYDNIKLNKGPSLGTNFTLVTAYTMLAHYDELDFARECGISPDLIRVSVGIEDIATLKNIFIEALGHA